MGKLSDAFVGADVDLQLMGAHQLDNAAAAITAAQHLRHDNFPQISGDTIVEGLSTASLPGRFQVSLKPHLCAYFQEYQLRLLSGLCPTT